MAMSARTRVMIGGCFAATTCGGETGCCRYEIRRGEGASRDEAKPLLGSSTALRGDGARRPPLTPSVVGVERDAVSTNGGWKAGSFPFRVYKMAPPRGVSRQLLLWEARERERERGEEGDDGGGFEVDSFSAAASRSPTCICSFLRFEERGSFTEETEGGHGERDERRCSCGSEVSFVTPSSIW
ncbi:hypothetical protein BHE74_00047648 [Ensete ventricosum]|nr:hypothetical protein BHE74_00047648 [Ensete ventricosum]